MREKACRKCRRLSLGPICPNCKEGGLSEDYSGLVVVFDPEKSAIAKKSGIDKPGRYAIKVR